MSAASYLATIERLKGNRRAIRGVAPWAVAAGALALAGVIAAAWVTAALVGRSQVARSNAPGAGDEPGCHSTSGCDLPGEREPCDEAARRGENLGLVTRGVRGRAGGAAIGDERAMRVR